MPDPRPRHRPAVPDLGLLLASTLGFAGFAAVLTTVVLDGGTDRFDVWVSAQLALLPGAGASAVAAAVTGLGSFAAVVSAAGVAITGLWVQTRRLWAPLILASSLAATASLVTLLKIAVGRPHPSVATLIGTSTRDSFPSGYTANATLVYVLAVLLLTARARRAFWRRLAAVSAVALSVLIGLSRVYLGHHWATDVLAGWLLAAGVIAASLFTTRRLEPTDDEDSLVEPVGPVRHHRTRPHHLVG